MTTDDTTPSQDAGSDHGYHDQDSEPTMNAPEEGRPDGLEALKPDAGPEQTESSREGVTQRHSDPELLEAQEEEQPTDE